MMQAVVFQGITQSLRNVLLTGYLVKGLRPPFSCNHLIAHLMYNAKWTMKTEIALWPANSSFSVVRCPLNLAASDLPATQAEIATVALFPA